MNSIPTLQRQNPKARQIAASLRDALGLEFSLCEESELTSFVDGKPLFGPTTLRVNGAIVLAIPQTIDDQSLAAIAELPPSQADAGIRMARMFLKQQQMTSESRRLQQQVDEFAREMSSNFEEMAFMRTVADELGYATADSSLCDLGRRLLPTLRETVECEAVALIEKRGDHARMMVSDTHRAVEFKAGNWWTILEKRQEQAETSPVVVVNRIQERSDDLSKLHERGIRDFVLARIGKLDRGFGYLMLANRIVAPSRAEAFYRTPLSQFEFGSVEASLTMSVCTMLAAHAINCELFREKEQLIVDVVQSFVSSIEAKDGYTCGHSQRVAQYAARLAYELKLSPLEIEKIILTGLLHDVGKIGVSDAVLSKDGPLTDEEFDEIKKHPDLGWAILHKLTGLSYTFPGVVHHHERYDGGGYPDGLAGEAIPRDGRLLAIADAYDAMTSDRPYRPGMSQEKAVAIIREGAGTQWDPTMVAAFLRAMPDIIEIRRSYRAPQRPQRRTSPVSTNPQDQ